MRLHRLLLCFLLLASLIAACTPVRQTPTPTSPPTPTAWPRAPLASPDYGVQAFLYWRYESADRDIKLIQDMGFPGQAYCLV
jgi:hypothetical protein